MQVVLYPWSAHELSTASVQLKCQYSGFGRLYPPVSSFSVLSSLFNKIQSLSVPSLLAPPPRIHILPHMQWFWRKYILNFWRNRSPVTARNITPLSKLQAQLATIHAVSLWLLQCPPYHSRLKIMRKLFQITIYVKHKQHCSIAIIEMKTQAVLR